MFKSHRSETSVSIISSLKLHSDNFLYNHTDCACSSVDISKKAPAMLKAIFSVKRMLSKEEIILDALWHQYICTSLLLSANVRRQSLHLAVHCKPDCPSHCPVLLSPCCNPKDMHRTATCLLSSNPPPPRDTALSSVLWVLQAV